MIFVLHSRVFGLVGASCRFWPRPGWGVPLLALRGFIGRFRPFWVVCCMVCMCAPRSRPVRSALRAAAGGAWDVPVTRLPKGNDVTVQVTLSHILTL